VGDVAGELSDSLHLLRLVEAFLARPQCALGAIAFGDVDQDADDSCCRIFIRGVQRVDTNHLLGKPEIHRPAAQTRREQYLWRYQRGRPTMGRVRVYRWHQMGRMQRAIQGRLAGRVERKSDLPRPGRCHVRQEHVAIRANHDWGLCDARHAGVQWRYAVNNDRQVFSILRTQGRAERSA